MGIAKAAVFPVPVRAWPKTSFPCKALGIIPAWTGEGVWYSARASASIMTLERPNPENPNSERSCGLEIVSAESMAHKLAGCNDWVNDGLTGS
jgi:hypothetical protein